MLKVIFITLRTNAVDSVVVDFHSVKAAEAAIKAFNSNNLSSTFIAKRLYDLEEEIRAETEAKALSLVIARPDLDKGKFGDIKGSERGDIRET